MAMPYAAVKETGEPHMRGTAKQAPDGLKPQCRRDLPRGRAEMRTPPRAAAEPAGTGARGAAWARHGPGPGAPPKAPAAGAGKNYTSRSVALANPPVLGYWAPGRSCHTLSLSRFGIDWIGHYLSLLRRACLFSFCKVPGRRRGAEG